MSNKKPSAFVNFIAAASITTLLSSNVTAGIEAEQHNQPSDTPTTTIQDQTPARTFMSESTKATYGKQIEFITDYTPGLTILTMTPSDLGIDFTQQDKENLALQYMCPPNMMPQTEEMVNTILKIEAAQDSMQALFKDLSEGDEPFISKQALMSTLLNNNRELSEYTAGAAATVLSGEPASYSFTQILKDNDRNIAIISMPDTFDRDAMIQGIGALPIDYFNGIESTKEDVLFFILGHEIAGHAYNAHNNDNFNVDYNCTMINDVWVNGSNVNESVGDIMGSHIHVEAQKAGLVSKANTPQEMGALRAIANLYIGSNSATYTNTSDINDHVSTIIFDPNTPTFQSNMRTEGTALLPATINRLADAISGYVSTLDFKKDMQANPQLYNEGQHQFFGSLSDDPKDFAQHIDQFAKLGQDLRQGVPAMDGMNEIKQQPEWHYAAIAFIHEHDLLKTVKEETIPSYNQVIDDLITDFLDATDKHAKKLKDPSIAQKIESTLSPAHFSFLDFDAFLGIKEQQEPQITSELTPQM